MSIRVKLYCGFGVLVILALGLVVYAVQTFGIAGYWSPDWTELQKCHADVAGRGISGAAAPHRAALCL